MFGVMVGAGGISQLSDILGRKWLFLLSTWALFVVSFCQAFVNSYVAFAIVRFLTGVFYAV